MMPGTYHFKVTYAGKTQQQNNIDIETTPTITFQTIPVTAKLLDSVGNPIEGGEAKYYASGWKDFGTTDLNGEATRELLPGSYHFKMTYAGETQQINNIEITTTPIITYQTGKVHSNSNNVTQYYASGWKTFTQDMELLPDTYKFKYDDGTQKQFTVDAGKINYID
jgi:hypothetical protein